MPEVCGLARLFFCVMRMQRAHMSSCSKLVDKSFRD